MRPGTPVVLVCGLDQGLVDDLARSLPRPPTGLQVAYRMAVGGTDPVLVRTTTSDGVQPADELLATSHGCLSCAIRDDVVALLDGLAGDPTPVAVVLPAGADPACLVDPLDLAAVAVEEGRATAASDGPPLPHARIVAVVAAVAADRLLAQATTSDEIGETDLPHGSYGGRPVAELVLDTLAVADVVVLGESADAPEAASAGALALVGHVAPHAQVVAAGDPDAIAAAVAAAVHDLTRTDLRHEPLAIPATVGVAAAGLMSQVWSTRRPLHPQRLMDVLEHLGESVVRLDGPVWLATRPHEVLRLSIAGGAAALTCVDAWLSDAPAAAWDEVSPWRRVQAEVSWDPYYGDRQCRVAVLTRGAPMDHRRVIDLLDTLALSDDELAAGGEAWIAVADPFTPWLGADWPEHPQVMASLAADPPTDRTPASGRKDV